MLSWLTDRRVSGLSPTEERVLRLRARGLVNKVVAHDLGISEQTVKSHAASAYHKLGVDSLVGALRALGWITLPDESEPEEQCATVARCGRNADHRGQHGGFRPIFEAEA